MGTVRRGMPTRPGPTTRQGDGRAYRTHRGRTTERATRSHIVTWEMMGPVYTIDNILHVPHRSTLVEFYAVSFLRPSRTLPTTILFRSPVPFASFPEFRRPCHHGLRQLRGRRG
jgi:hypothetical protein